MTLHDVPLRCGCGHIRGVARDVAAPEGFRFLCYCHDCQAFARFLGRPDVLDPSGGTDIFQMPAARVQLTAGADALRCVRFSPRVLRWYAECCRTPIANTGGPGFPIVALIHSFMDHSGGSRDQALGRPLCRIFERSARGPLPTSAPPPPSVRIFALRGWRMIRWRMRGLHRPSPFFDDLGKPRAQPRVIDRR
jgi:hypothetical protein